MSRKRTVFNVLLVLGLAFSLLTNSVGSALAQKDSPPKIDPRLLQMAEANPDAIFRIIVQKEAKIKDLKDMEVENEVLKGGGKLRKQLDLITSFSAEMTGKEIVKLARHPKVRWISADAPMVSTAAPGMETYRDEFDSISYFGSNGTQEWSKNPWTELYELDGLSNGIVEIADGNCASGNCLEFKGHSDGKWGVSRTVNLQGAVTATLSFDYKNVQYANGGFTVKIVSSEGLYTAWPYSLGSTNSEYETIQINMTMFASAATRVEFIVNTDHDDFEVYIDNVEIAYAYPSAYVSAVRADQVALTGIDVAVAVIDSGIAYHDDFDKTGSRRSRILMNEYFTDSGGSEDLYGHGTHVAGIIAGNGKESNGKYRGIATEARPINLKVADKNGMIYESDVIEALQWVYNNKATYNIRVVNLSVNSTVAQSYHTSPLSAAVEILWFNNIVVVVSAGNNGTGEGPVTLYPPANDPFVITVGAVEDKSTSGLGDDTLAVFSAYGTTEDGFVKPDLVAPGRNLIAPLAEKASTVYVEHPLHRVNDYYFRMSGTSMSAPVVTGAVALLLENEPNLNPDQVKHRLMATANYNWSSAAVMQAPTETSSTGYLDVYEAVNGTTTDYANQGIMPSLMLASGEDGIDFTSVGWNSVGWNSVGWNSVGWNSVGWNSVGWNSVGWNSVGWNTSTWDD